VAVLSAEEVLGVDSPLLFICPLSSRSDSVYDALHVRLPARDGLKVQSYALVEHCRAISRSRLSSQRIAQLTEQELATILHRLQRLVGL
jgi:mRNA interferase MazF